MRKGWEYKKLGEVCVYPSKRILVSELNPKDYVGVENLQKDRAGVVFSDKMPNTNSAIAFSPNDILIGNIRPYLKKIWLADKSGGASGDVVIIRISTNDLLPMFLYKVLASDHFFEYDNTFTKGAKMPRGDRNAIAEFMIPLPPKSTQLAIVSELDKINELIRLKKEQLKDFDNLAQSLFYEMFGDPVENEKGWEVKKLGDVCTDIKYGTSKPASENGRYTYLRMCNLTTDGFLDLSNTKQIDIPDDEIEKCIVRYGDILFNRTNSIELVGKTCLFDKKEPMVIAGYIIRVRLNDTLLPVVLARMFNLASIKKLLRSMAKGAVNQANINSKELASIRIPLPPLSLQRLFAQRIEQIEREKSEVQKSIQDLETLQASRMQYWFE